MPIIKATQSYATNKSTIQPLTSVNHVRRTPKSIDFQRSSTDGYRQYPLSDDYAERQAYVDLEKSPVTSYEHRPAYVGYQQSLKSAGGYRQSPVSAGNVHSTTKVGYHLDKDRWSPAPTDYVQNPAYVGYRQKPRYLKQTRAAFGHPRDSLRSFVGNRHDSTPVVYRQTSTSDSCRQNISPNSHPSYAAKDRFRHQTDYQQETVSTASRQPLGQNVSTRRHMFCGRCRMYNHWTRDCRWQKSRNTPDRNGRRINSDNILNRNKNMFCDKYGFSDHSARTCTDNISQSEWFTLRPRYSSRDLSHR